MPLIITRDLKELKFDMELHAVDNTKQFKKNFLKSFQALREQNKSFNTFIYEVSIKNNLFIVGGYLRSIANNEKPRDLDLIINLKKSELDDIIRSCFIRFTENRLGGYKVQLENIAIDAWSIEDNWAFKKKLIKNVELNYLEKISKGTFFNYDSLVLDLHTFQCNFKSYNECAKTKVLDILKKNSNYKKLNPTREANILRAFYLRTKYNLLFSNQLKHYIEENLEYSKQAFGNSLPPLLTTLHKYTKYESVLSEPIIKQIITEINISV